MSAEVLLPAALLVVSLVYLARTAPVQARSGLPEGSGRGEESAPSLPASDEEQHAAWPLDGLRKDITTANEPILYGVCELDGFENIRKHVGYRIANALVSDVAAVIGVGLPSCTIGRSNRTTIEFAWSQADADAAHRAVEALQAALPRTFELEGCQLDVQPRIAFQRVSPATPAESAFELIDAVLGDPSKHHLDVICVPEDDGTAGDERLYLLKELSAAITNDRLSVHYQPKLDCRTERVTSVEALLRWTHFSLGQIGPDKVVQAAEETGLIRRLTVWVLRQVVQDLGALRAARLEVPIYVNISGALLPDERFAAMAVDMVRGHEALIGFEITETAVIRDPDRAMANLARFRDAGISIAIDDYGSGLSSLAYLKRLPAQELKIDQLFISGLTSEHRDPLLVRSSIDLAHALEMKVTAEGVDNPMALSLLTIMGCDMVQGYLISRPLPLDRLIEFLGRESHVAHMQTTPTLLFGARNR